MADKKDPKKGGEQIEEPKAARANKKTEEAKNERKKDEAKTEQLPITPKRLYRTKRNAMIAGVAAGIAEYFNVDPAVVRLIFVLATIFGGSGVLVYIILWVVLPEESTGVIGSHETVRANVQELKGKAEDLAKGIQSQVSSGSWRANSTELRTKSMVGYILIGLGVLFVLQNFGFFRVDIFWPIVLVAIGLL